MPQTFLWMTSEDGLVDVDEGLDKVKTLALAGVSYEFDVFKKRYTWNVIVEPACRIRENCPGGI